MKKLTLILIAGAISAPLFAFDFNATNFNMDDNIKTEIGLIIAGKVNNIVQENNWYNQETQVEYHHDNDITLAINSQLRITREIIKNNCKLPTRHTPNRKFVKEQEIQQQRYNNIVEWGIPYKISDYIQKNKFNLQNIGFISVICTHTNNKTGIEVHFKYNSENVIVTYTYTETYWNPSITHKIIK